MPLLRVSRQFSSEYSECSSKVQGLCIEDHDDCVWQPPLIPQQLKHLQLRHISLLLFKGKIQREGGISDHTRWIKDMENYIKSGTEVRMYMEMDHQGKDRVESTDLEWELRELLTVQSLENISALTWRYSAPPLDLRWEKVAEEQNYVVQHGGDRIGGWSRIGGWAWDWKVTTKTASETENNDAAH